MSSLNVNAVVTDVRLAAASVATPYGPYIKITNFKLGSVAGYTPTRHDTGLRGAVVYEDVVSSYHHIPPKTINVRCRIDPIHGPFEFGELGLFLESGELFAKMVFPKLQLKTSSLMTSVASSYTFNCLIKLEQSIAIFDITTDCGPEMLVVERWSDVYPPTTPIFDGVPSMLVTELDKWGRSSLLHYASPNKWTIGSTYNRYTQSAVVSGTTTSVVLNGNGFPDSVSFLTGSANRDFVLEFPNSVFRSVSSITQVGNNFRFNLNPAPLRTPPAVGTQVVVHHDPYLRVSRDPGNRIEWRRDGIGVWDTAPPDVAMQYVSASLGNDDNPGTQAQPLRTLSRALERIPPENGGSFWIRLRAGETFSVPQGETHLRGYINISVYDDPKYADGRGALLSPIGLAVDCTRATLNIGTHTKDGMVFPNVINGAAGLQLQALKVNCPGTITAPVPQVGIIGSEVIFWGSEVYIPEGTYGSAGTKMTSIQSDWFLGDGAKLTFNTSIVADLYNQPPGSVTPPMNGNPAFTVKGSNIKQVANVDNISTPGAYSYNVATQSLFGISINWNIFNP